MLTPQDRNHLLSILRPPDGYELNCAIGTTFSLDLYTLLTVPLAFTLFDFEDENGLPNSDPLALLEAVRRHADNMHIFCQAGHILLPKAQATRLLCYLEDTIIEVDPPNSKGVFHPKFWAIRFLADNKPVIYRVICLSRNLTYDRSWDTVLVLEGTLQDRERAYSGNHPLGDFIQALPSLAINTVSPRVKKNIETVQHELRRTIFDLPQEFHTIKFWPLGIEGHTADPLESINYRRILIMSPFLSKGRLEMLSEYGSDNLLISRTESLDEIDAETLKAFSFIYALDSNATPEPEEESEVAEELRSVENNSLQGLHAKLFIADEGWDTHVLTGSANATNAAFNNNVEILVELVGKKSQCGIDAFLKQTAGEVCFKDLLHEYSPSTEPAISDPTTKMLEECVEDIRRTLGRAGMRILLEKHSENEVFDLKILLDNTRSFDIPSFVEIKCRPTTFTDTLFKVPSFNSSLVAEFSSISFDAITPFIAFEASAKKDGKNAAAYFVLNMPMSGAPADRKEQVLRSLIKNKEQFIRLLMLLLYEGGISFMDRLGAMRDFLSGKTDFKKNEAEIYIFETLLRALENNPKKLNQVARLITDICNTPGGRECLPEGFEEIWNPIWAVKEELYK